MRNSEFKNVYNAMERANEEDMRIIQSCGYLFIDMTEKQIAKVKNLLIEKGIKQESDGSVKWGMYIFR